MARILPPTLVLILTVVAVSAGTWAPLSGRLPTSLRVLGIVGVAVGLTLTKKAHDLFLRRGATIGTFDKPVHLVASGPYRLTRHPMYLGFLIYLVGVAAVVGSLTALIGPVVFAVVADRFYIPFEERSMRATFGLEYDDYSQRVPRWLGPVSNRRGDQE